MLKELQDFGLSEKEARVYLAALEIGRATADQLAKQAKVNRSTTYVQIESLMKMGLMSTYEEDKKTYFAPESPENLARLVEKEQLNLTARKEELKKIVPRLTELFKGASDRPVVRFFTGKEGIVSIREEILGVRDKKISVIFSYDSLSQIFSDEEKDDYSRRRAGKGIQSNVIFVARDENFRISEVTSLIEHRYFDKKAMALDSDIVIFDNKVAVMNFKGRIFGVIIEDSGIAKSMKSIFDVLWATGRK